MARASLESAKITNHDVEYAAILATGLDYVQEAYRWSPTEEFETHLDYMQCKAAANGGRDGVETMAAGGEDFIIKATGAKGGIKWVLHNDDMIVMISRNRGYDVSVRYTSAGLWEHGWDALRARVWDMLGGGEFVEHEDPGHPKITRVDYAMDFQSDDFENDDLAQLASQIITSHKRKVCVAGKVPSAEKAMEIWAKGGMIETLTIGKMPGLQIQIYNKTKEITDVSGKEWMREIWSRSDCYDRNKNVFRLEIRFTKDHLKQRRVRTKEQFQEQLKPLVTDALISNRMVVRQKRGKPQGTACSGAVISTLFGIWQSLCAGLWTSPRLDAEQPVEGMF